MAGTRQDVARDLQPPLATLYGFFGCFTEHP